VSQTKTAEERIAAAEAKRNRRLVREATASASKPRKPKTRPRTNFGSRSRVDHYIPGHKLVFGTELTRRGTPKPTSWLEPLVRGEPATVFPCKRSAERAVYRTLMRTPLGLKDLPIRQVA